MTITHASGQNSARSLVSSAAFVLSGGSLTISDTLQINNTFSISKAELIGATVVKGTSSQAMTASGARLRSGVIVRGRGVLTHSGGSLTNEGAIGNVHRCQGEYHAVYLRWPRQSPLHHLSERQRRTLFRVQSSALTDYRWMNAQSKSLDSLHAVVRVGLESRAQTVNRRFDSGLDGSRQFEEVGIEIT